MEPEWVIAGAIILGAVIVAIAVSSLAKDLQKVASVLGRLNQTADLSRQGIKDRHAALGIKDSDWD